MNSIFILARFSRRIAGVACFFAAVLALGLPLAKAQNVDAKSAREVAQRIDPRTNKIGRLIPDFEFSDIDNQNYKLSQFSDKKALVFIFRTNGCPLCKKYTPAVKRIASEFASQGIQFFVVNPSEGDDPQTIRAAHKKYGLTLTTIHDPSGKFARAFGAKRTTDVFVLNSTRTLLYRGAIDDQYGLGLVKERASKNFLQDALSSIVAGKAVEISATSAPGCNLGVKSAANEPKTITWHNRVSRIVQRNCQECHRKGENGPFELMTYKDVKSNREMIKRVVSDRTMPPWFADKKVGHWANDRSLVSADRQALLSWIKAGCPKGDDRDESEAVPFYKGWKLGRPDAIITVPRPVIVPAEGVVPYTYVRMISSFSEDKWVQGIEVRPGAPEVVHHVLVFIKYPKNHPRAKDQPRQKGGLRGYFAGMVPGQATLMLPEGCAKLLPKGCQIIFQIHYTPNGVKVRDRTKMGLHFTSKPKNEVRTYGIADTRFRIPANDPNFQVVKSKRLSSDMRVLSLAPHMHLRGKSFLYEAILPNGSVKTLLNVPFFDFNWQLTYEFMNPIDLPKGTVIKVTAHFDNSSANLANPNPNRIVRFGEQTFDEMMIGYFNAYKLSPAVKSPKQKKAVKEPKPKRESF